MQYKKVLQKLHRQKVFVYEMPFGFFISSEEHKDLKEIGFADITEVHEDCIELRYFRVHFAGDPEDKRRDFIPFSSIKRVETDLVID